MTEERMEHLCKLFWAALPGTWGDQPEDIKQQVRERVAIIEKHFDDMIYKPHPMLSESDRMEFMRAFDTPKAMG